MDYDTQRWTVVNHIKQHGSITSIEAFEQYKITRLSAVIFDIKGNPEKYGIYIDPHTEDNGKTGRERKSWTRYYAFDYLPSGQLSLR